ncbi:MAG: hypothetical protein ACJAQT_000376 [Akkermansiaceae bacterium]|jgi:hypothetical protein
MGGLVSRSALAQLGTSSGKIEKLVMLGTPNHGSYSPIVLPSAVLARLFSRVAKLDLRNNARDLVDEAFATRGECPRRWDSIRGFRPIDERESFLTGFDCKLDGMPRARC